MKKIVPTRLNFEDYLAFSLLIFILWSPYVYNVNFPMRIDHPLVYIFFSLLILKQRKLYFYSPLVLGSLVILFLGLTLASVYIMFASNDYSFNIGSFDASARVFILVYIYSRVGSGFFYKNILGRTLICYAFFVYIIAAIQYMFDWNSLPVTIIADWYGGRIDPYYGMTWNQLCLRGGRLVGPFISAPSLGQFSVILFSYLIFYQKNSMMLTFFLMLISVFFGIQSGSFSYYFAMIIVIVTSIFITFFSKNNKLKTSILYTDATFVIIICAALFIVLNSLNFDFEGFFGYRVLEGVNRLLESESISGISGERFGSESIGVFSANYNILSDTFFMGTGFAWSKYGFYADSLFFYLMLQFGLIGFLAFTVMILMYLKVLYTSIINNHNIFFDFSFVIACVFVCLGLQSAIFYKDRIGDIFWIIGGLTYSFRRHLRCEE